MNTTEIGKLGEEYAVKYLIKNKYKILERNIHLSHNEIDIIAENKEYIIFVEVKTRSCLGKDTYLKYGTPAEAVTWKKRMRTVTAANQYLISNSKYINKQPRMDVIEIYLDKSTKRLVRLNHITDAFGAN